MNPQVIEKLAHLYMPGDGRNGCAERYLFPSVPTAPNAQALESLTLRAMRHLAAHDGDKNWADVGSTSRQVLLSEFGWLVDSLNTWAGIDDSKGWRFFGLLAVTAAWDRFDALWPNLRQLLSADGAWLKACEKVLGMVSVELGNGENAPIWEQEFAKVLIDADRGEDWPLLVDTFLRFRGQMRPSVELIASARALYVFAPERFLAVIKSKDRWLEAANMLFMLTPARRLQAATDGGSERMMFAALALSGDAQLNDDGVRAMEGLLGVLAQRPGGWASFLRAFLPRIGAHIAIMNALGAALAKADEHAVHAFVDAVELEASDNDAHPIALILKAFEERASAPLRKSAWGRAYARWDEWYFGKATECLLPLTTTGSTLDVSVAGWLKEFADVSVLADGIKATQLGLDTLGHQWHASSTALQGLIGMYRSRQRMFVEANVWRGGVPSRSLSPYEAALTWSRSH